MFFKREQATADHDAERDDRHGGEGRAVPEVIDDESGQRRPENARDRKAHGEQIEIAGAPRAAAEFACCLLHREVKPHVAQADEYGAGHQHGRVR